MSKFNKCLLLYHAKATKSIAIAIVFCTLTAVAQDYQLDYFQSQHSQGDLKKPQGIAMIKVR